VGLLPYVHPSLTYEIDGKLPLNGVGDLQRYWSRNAQRQKQLHLGYITVDQKVNSISCSFLAHFTDVDEQQEQIVSGIIHFFFSQGSDPKLLRVRETYLVDRTPLTLSAAKQFARSVADVGADLVRRFQLFWDAVKIVILFILIFLTALAAVITVLCIVMKVAPWPLLSVWQAAVGKINSPEEATRNLREAGAIFFGVTGVLLTIYQLFPIRDRNIQVYDVTRDDRDLKIMDRFMRDAVSVTTFSGNFDFLLRSRALLASMKRLQEQGRLILLSDSSRERVRRAITANSTALEIVDGLEHAGKIGYNTSVSIRASLIRTRRGKVLVLYRYTASVGANETLKICALYQRGPASEVVAALSKFFNDAAARIRNIDVAPISEVLPVAVIVTGEVKAGKSALCGRLAESGYHQVIASAVIAEEVPKGTTPTRHALLSQGMQFLGKEGEAAFGGILVAKAEGLDRVVFDGVRLPGAIEVIRAAFAVTVVIYVEASKEVRRGRFHKNSDGSMTFDETVGHPIENRVLDVRESADLILDGTGPIHLNVTRMCTYLFSKHVPSAT
jgi:hypothetical protein